MEWRNWPVRGPNKERWSLLEVAVELGYEDVDSIRRLVVDGRLPAPRGHGTNQYYSGLDMAIILEMSGRWGPRGRQSETTAKDDEKPRKPARSGEKTQEQDS